MEGIESHPDALLAGRLVCQHGLATAADVQSAGLSLRSMRRRVERGLFEDDGRDLWRSTAWPRTDEQRWLAACLAHGSDAVVTWNDAARVHAMPGRHPSDKVHVLCSGAGKVRRPGVVTHRSKLIVPADRTVVRGVPVASWARAWVELSGRADLSDRLLLWIYDEGIRRKVMTASEAHHTANRLRAGPGRSMRRVHRLLDQRPMDHDPGASQPEGRIALWMRAAGYGKPVMNLHIWLDGVLWEIDVAYVKKRVAVDYQSEEIHGGANLAVQEKDARKKAVFEAAGWVFETVGPDDDEATVVERIGRHLR